MNFQPQQFFSQNPLDLVLNAGIVAKCVLGLLFLFSIVSWAIILDKWRIFRRVNRQSNRFLTQFRMRKSAREIFDSSNEMTDNPFAAVFKEAYWLFNKRERHPQDPDLVRESRRSINHTATDLVRLFDSVASREVLKLEKFLIFLATTGSISPFLGLFGTVWGVMGAFLSIGMTGSADLSVVAPGIAEALITTVAGLGAAIPAVIAYNYFVNKLKRLSSELEIFYSDMIEAFSRKETHEVR